MLRHSDVFGSCASSELDVDMVFWPLQHVTLFMHFVPHRAVCSELQQCVYVCFSGVFQQEFGPHPGSGGKRESVRVMLRQVVSLLISCG